MKFDNKSIVYYTQENIKNYLSHDKYAIKLRSINDYIEFTKNLNKDDILFFDIETTYNDAKKLHYGNYEVYAKANESVNRPMFFLIKKAGSDNVYVFDVWEGEFNDKIISSTLAFLGIIQFFKIVIHNGKKFDIPVIYEFYKHYENLDLPRIMRRIWQNTYDTYEVTKEKLGEKASGSLKNIMQREFGLKISKELQGTRWNLRPITNDMLLYAGLDTIYLEAIYNKYNGFKNETINVVTVDDLLKQLQ